MFCMKCGKEMADGAQFCPSCGASAGITTAASSALMPPAPTGKPVVPVPAPMTAIERERQASRNRFGLAAMVRKEASRFELVRQDYAMLPQLQRLIASLQRSQRKHMWLILSLIWTLPFFYICYGFWTSALVWLPPTEGMTSETYLLAQVLVIGIFIGMFFTPLAISLGVRFSRAREIQRKTQQFDASVGRIISHYRSISDPLCSVENSDPAMLGAISRMLEQGKADTVKEAIVRIDDENTAATIIGLQQAQLDEIRSVKRAVIGVGVIAAMR